MKSVYIPIGNQKIKATVILPLRLKGKNPAVLLIHGWASSETSHIPRAEAIANLGYVCLTIDLRGHGKSDGSLDGFSRQDHLEDIIGAYDFLANQKGIDRNKISICGSSYGGYLAAILSSKRDVYSLVLRGPSLYTDDDFFTPTATIIKNNPQVFKQKNLSEKENLALRALSKFNGPILLVESKKDDIVPKETTRNYLHFINSTLLTHETIKDADHILSKKSWQREYINILTKWYKKLLESHLNEAPQSSQL